MNLAKIVICVVSCKYNKQKLKIVLHNGLRLQYPRLEINMLRQPRQPDLYLTRGRPTECPATRGVRAGRPLRLKAGGLASAGVPDFKGCVAHELIFVDALLNQTMPLRYGYTTPN